jgi:hypothetical protein
MRANSIASGEKPIQCLSIKLLRVWEQGQVSINTLAGARSRDASTNAREDASTTIFGSNRRDGGERRMTRGAK